MTWIKKKIHLVYFRNLTKNVWISHFSGPFISSNDIWMSLNMIRLKSLHWANQNPEVLQLSEERKKFVNVCSSYLWATTQQHGAYLTTFTDILALLLNNVPVIQHKKWTAFNNASQMTSVSMFYHYFPLLLTGVIHFMLHVHCIFFLFKGPVCKIYYHLVVKSVFVFVNVISSPPSCHIFHHFIRSDVREKILQPQVYDFLDFSFFLFVF